MRSSLVVLATLVLWMSPAMAGRKRLVVLDFEGPKAEKFHADVVKLMKKGHTVLAVDKWNAKAEEMDASAVTDKNIKKLAKKLKIDGVVVGKIEKRRDEYILRLKLRSGATGEIVGNPVQTKADGPGLDAQAKRDIKDELMPAVDELESMHSGGDEGDDEEADAPKKKDEADEEEDSGKKSGFSKKKLMKDDEASDEEESPKLTKKQKAEEEKKKKEEEAKAKKAEEEEAKRLAKEEEQRKKDEEKKKKDDEKKKKAEEAALVTKKDKKDTEDEEADEEESSSKKRASADEEDEDRGSRKAKKRKASADEDEESVSDSADTESSGGRDLSPAGRALDAVVGMSFTARNLKFAYASDLGKPPPGYKQPVPVAGAMLDVTLYPLAFGKTQGLLRGLGATVLYDQVLVINSQKRYSDQAGMSQIANLSTKENRWMAGPVFRYPLGKLVVGGSLTYGKQQFSITQKLPNNDPTDIPSVAYTMFTVAPFVKYALSPKITLNGDLAVHAVTDTGQIQASGMTGYGAATVTAYGVEVGGDYMVTKNIFARVSLRYDSFGLKFKGDPTSQTNIRDTDPEQDVTGAKDTYMGGSATVGYVY